MDSVFPEESVNPPATPATTAPVTTPVSDPAQPTSDTVDEAEQEKEFTSQVFKRQVQKLIDKGLWQDVEGLDEMVLDEDSFDELARMQDEYRIEQGWQSVKQASPLVNDIFSIIEAGGNPEQILELHRDHQQLAAINTDTLEGKKELIARYYEDVVGFPKTEVNRRLKKLDLDGEAEIEAEFSIANQKYGEHFQKEKDRITQAETDRLAAIEARKRQKLEASVAHLRSQKVADSEIRSQLGAIYTPKWKMPDTGEVLSEFDYQLLQIRNDPQKSLELARFVLNRDKFVKELTTQATNQVVEQNYQKLKFKPKPTATTPAPGQSGPGRPRTDTPENLYKPFLS
ncbi:hypothetical protein CLV58_109161 [Spirosoma oryzae]|uniref:Uncharacterized protein n=2 Tax=Spirosoma oryzae TaxID=1469603 RepID=A0A2T0SYF4_9BACT|nr:hypothetical protein CLV58_109161 [Spirosoma oryzae]